MLLWSKVADVARAGQVSKILFICTANICRSPMAEAIFNAVAEDRKLPFRAQSAGVRAFEGAPLAPHAATVLDEAGIPLRNHRARQINAPMLEQAELVLAMSPNHLPHLLRLQDGAASKIHTLPAFATQTASPDGISDPYGSSIFTYRSCLRLLMHYTELLVSRLES